MTEFKGYTLTSKESEALEALLKEMREEEKKQYAIQEQKMRIDAAVTAAISVIGIEETEHILRLVIRTVRNLKRLK